MNTEAQELVATIERMYAALGDDNRTRLDEVQGKLGAVVYMNHGSIAESPGAEPTPLS